MIRKMFPEDIGTWARENPDRLGIQIMRFIFGALWLSQGLSKVFKRDNDMYKDNNKFLDNLNYMKDTNPYPAVVSLLNEVLIPNVSVFLVLVVITELLIGLSLSLGLLSRLGSLLGGFMAINLWILTLGWGEWIWTYPLIFFPHVLLFLSHVGKEVGVDRFLSEKENFTNKKLINLLM